MPTTIPEPRAATAVAALLENTIYLSLVVITVALTKVVLPATNNVPPIIKLPPIVAVFETFNDVAFTVLDTREDTVNVVLTLTPEVLAIKLPLLTLIPLLNAIVFPVKVKLPDNVLLSVDNT